MNSQLTLVEQKFVEDILEDVAKKLGLQFNSISIEYQSISNGFDSTDVGAKTARNLPPRICINVDWFRKHKDNDDSVIYDILAHEMRHIYQLNQIANLKAGKETSEPVDVILRWENNFNNYKSYSSTDTNTHRPYFSQDIEVDAMAFSWLYRTDVKIDSGLSIPEDIWPFIEKRIEKIRMT